MKTIFFISILLFFNLNTMIADEWERVENLRGYWKFSIGDDMEWSKPEYNDFYWEEVRVPSSWEDQGFHGYNGYAWYRKEFKLNMTGLSSTLYLQMGYIDDADEVYLNGKLIGKSGGFPPRFETAYNAFRKYPIPQSLLSINGRNLLAVMVYDSQLAGGIVSGDIGIFMRYYEIKPVLNLEGEWKFRINDNNKWKNVDLDDSDWDEIIVPGFWENQGYEDYNGFAWYRKTFTVPNNLTKEKLVILLGKIDDIDEAYLNGVRIGATGDMYDDPFYISFDQEYNEFRGYYVPQGLIKAGINVLAVRVYDGFREGGIYEGPIGLIEQDDYVKFWRNKKRRNIWEIIFGN